MTKMSTEKADLIFPATAMPDAEWWTALWPEPKTVLGSLGFRAGLAAVDLCCGDGYFTAAMSQMLGGAVWGVDLDPAMLEQARAAIFAAGAPECPLIEADARDLAGVIPEKVDLVLIANTFHGVPDQTGLARAVAEVLKPGGQFIVVSWHNRPREETLVLGQPRGPRSDMRMSPEDTARVVEPAGFRLSKTVDLPPYHYGAMFRLD
jgi:SAM-dependent methyltransferase